MADSVYDQSLDIVATQVKTLADAIHTSLIPESALTPRMFDWDDLDKYPGLSLRSIDTPAEYANITEDTNFASNVGYKFILVMAWKGQANRDQRMKYFRSLLESVRKFYHHRRRLGAVSVTGVRENSCTVRNGGPTPPVDLKLNHKIEMLTITGWFLEPRS